MILNTLRHLRHGPLRRLNTVWTTLGRIYRRVVCRWNLTVRQMIGPYGPFKLDAQFAFSNFSHWGQGHNDGFHACIEACRGKRCVLDVGAHIGLVVLPASSVLAPGGRVVAFEPAAANRELLDIHVRLNGFEGVVQIEAALVGADDRDDVQLFEMNGVTGMNSIVPGAMDDTYRPVIRRQVTLDSYCQRNRLSPEVIKIDVEGAELGVLRGARGTIARCRPKIFLSVHPRQIALLGEDVEDLRALIEDMHYDACNADGSPAFDFKLREYILTARES